jgi:cellulose synthase/poly-beta-1,6-N-acetylglucosamine synthase-like glycosyltransferase
VAIADPQHLDAVAALIEQHTDSYSFVLASRADLEAFVAASARDYLSDRANMICPKQFSARNWRGVVPIFFGMVFSGGLGSLAYYYPQLVFSVLAVWILTALICNTTFKIICMIAYFRSRPPRRQKIRPLDQLNKLPKVSILIPLLRESDILDRLIERMSVLDYPVELLEICLVYEETDAETKAHLVGRYLPPQFKIVEVPKSRVQTKPRAMNYALDFCQGEVIGVFDAEDAPEPDQIRSVVEHLAAAPPDVASVQCVLDYYNTKTNWLSRCFAIEYAILFRVILRGLDRLKLPIPLGGTSVYFRREILEKIGRWDAHNVTEDADLGMRMKRLGYRCEMVNSTTYEEANFRFRPWVKQRSRWLKGFMMTWITHLSRPRALFRDLGLLGFITFNILFLGTMTAFATAPVVLPLWLLTFGFELPFYSTLSPLFLNTLIAAFITTELILFLLGFVAVRGPNHRHLRTFLPSMIFYWPIGCIAAYKAIFELFTRPSYWDKTQHGINDHEFQAEISRLTTDNTAQGRWKLKPKG